MNLWCTIDDFINKIKENREKKTYLLPETNKKKRTPFSKNNGRTVFLEAVLLFRAKHITKRYLN